MTDQMLNQKIVVDDPWESAANPSYGASEFWGQLFIDMKYVVLEKNVGKVDFNPSIHSADKRCTGIEMILAPLPEQNLRFEVSRNTIAEGKEWVKFILPSIKNLGLSPRELNGKFVKLQFKKTGETYTNRNGEEKENTTFEFLKVFQNEDECRADYNGESGTTSQAQPVNSVSNAAPEDKAKATAFQFLKAIVNEACKGEKDLEKVRDVISKKIVAMPMISAHYTVDSTETVELIAEAIGK